MNDIEEMKQKESKLLEELRREFRKPHYSRSKVLRLVADINFLMKGIEWQKRLRSPKWIAFNATKEYEENV